MIAPENRLDVWWDEDADSITVQAILLSYIESIPGAQVYGICGTPSGMNIVGHAPRTAIEQLISISDGLGIRVVDHAKEGV